MLWRVIPLSTIKNIVLPAAPRSVKSKLQRLPCDFRAITTIRAFLTVPIGDDTNIEDSRDTRTPAEGAEIRKNATFEETKALIESAATQLPARPIRVRCADLLASARNTSDEEKAAPSSKQIVSIRGLVKSVRKQKHVAFAHITDGSCFEPLQVVLAPELAEQLTNGTSLEVTGMWGISPAKGQAYELKAEEVSILGTTDAEASGQDYPIQKKYQTPEFLRTIPHLRIRTPSGSAIARFRSSFLWLINDYFAVAKKEEGIFVQVQPPLITSSDCEGAGEVFTVVSNTQPSSSEHVEKNVTTTSPASFFRTPKYLTVSSQLHLEAYAAELQNVWALSPTFRAEKSDTPRHLAEFYMLEVEMSYTTSLRELTRSVERLIRFVASELMERPTFKELLLANHAKTDDGGDKVNEIQRRWTALSGESWKRASYSYCMKHLREAAKADPKLFERQPEFRSGLQLEHERWIVEHIGLNRPIFVTHYPMAQKPFYMAPSLLAKDHYRHPNHNAREDGREHFEASETGEDTVACFDLLMPFGVSEIVGGSLREHRLEHLIRNMRQHGMLKPKSPPPPSSSSSNQADHVSHPARTNQNVYPFLQPGESLGSLQWYADLRRYGTMPHGGYGIGVDRLIAYLTGVHNVREVVAFPRTFGRADC